ncbi:hypothetical protein [Sphingobium sp. KCTC 72723]|uniref:hypothetical protein n=1 Tax=Sphingobium sp. KCTC 72723 TaxID=2733867 RepID=UPI001CB7249C|nr:hypothetical protein [Sphingobium sp. KCTC 72723]
MSVHLSSLRQPPKVGRFYLVPVIRDFRYMGRVGTSPVIGPAHTDNGILNFPHRHYHVDARFLTAAQVRLIENWTGNTVDGAVGQWPLHDRTVELPRGRPAVARRKCRSADSNYAHGGKPTIQQLRKSYGDEVQPVRLPDGRVLCPHRKADLTQYPADGDGIVTCPLHGLRVCVGKAVAA